MTIEAQEFEAHKRWHCITIWYGYGNFAEWILTLQVMKSRRRLFRKPSGGYYF